MKQKKLIISLEVFGVLFWRHSKRRCSYGPHEHAGMAESFVILEIERQKQTGRHPNTSPRWMDQSYGSYV